jgi:TP901 family phage tail tape measure protein
MADRIKGITVEIGGDTTGLSKALSGVNKEIKSTQTQLKDVNKLLKLDPTNTTLLEQKQKLLQTAITETKDKLSQLKSVQDQMDEGLKNGTVTQQQYDAWQREIIATEQELKNLEKEAKNTDSSISATLKETGSTMQEVGGRISGVGESLSKGVTAPIAAIGAASLAAFSEVDSGLDIVEQKTGATGDALEEMNQIVKDLATEIPTDFETAGSAVGEVNTRFGLTGQALDDLSAKFIKFASLNDTDVSTSVDNVSSVLNAFGQSTNDAGNLLDALNATGQATGISMDTLANDLSQNAAQFKEMGLTAQEAAGFMGMVEMSGLDTSTAMAGLKKAMKNAADDGISLDDAMKNFSETMNSNASDTDKLSAAYDLFGSKAGAAIYNAVQTGKLNLDDLSGSLGDFAGSVDNTFNETLDPIDQFQMTLNSLKEVGADIGNSLATVLQPVLQDISAALQRFADVWNSIPAPVQETIVKIALVAAAVGPVLIVVGKLITSVGTILTIIPKISSAMAVVKTGMAALNGVMAANPIGLIITAIGLLVAAFIYLWNNCESFRNFWINLWDNIKEVAVTVFTALKDFFVTIWEAIKNVFTSAVNGISSFLSGAWNGIKTVATTVMNAISTVIQTVWNGIKTFFTTIFSAIQTVVTTYFNIYKTVITTVLNAIKTVVTTVWNAIKTAITTVVNAIKTVVTTAWNGIKTVTSTVFNAVKSVATSVWNGIKSAVMSVVNTMKSGITSVFNAIKSTLSGILNGIKSTFSSVFNGIWSFVSGIVSKLKNVFNFHWELPKIKLPHFSVSGKFSLNPPSIPHFSVSWYKKAMEGGMILKDATIFGQSGNTLLGGGEAGDEAVVGVNSLRNMIKEAVSENAGYSGPLINIETMSVRSDDDIRKISQQLNTLLVGSRRAKGSVI